MSVTTEKTAHDPAIRPLTIEVPDAELEALRARIAATQWPEKETVGDQSQGPSLATMQALARYWAEEYDWRRCERKLNACRTSSPRSMGSIFISSTFVRKRKMCCRSSSRTGGPARSSSS